MKKSALRKLLDRFMYDDVKKELVQWMKEDVIVATVRRELTQHTLSRMPLEEIVKAEKYNMAREMGDLLMKNGQFEIMELAHSGLPVDPNSSVPEDRIPSGRKRLELRVCMIKEDQ